MKFYLAMVVMLLLCLGFLLFPEDNPDSDIQDYSPEETDLAEFLDQRQSIQELYLVARQALLNQRRF